MAPYRILNTYSDLKNIITSNLHNHPLTYIFINHIKYLYLKKCEYQGLKNLFDLLWVIH